VGDEAEQRSDSPLYVSVSDERLMAAVQVSVACKLVLGLAVLFDGPFRQLSVRGPRSKME
jgi:hypothetical protein